MSRPAPSSPESPWSGRLSMRRSSCSAASSPRSRAPLSTTVIGACRYGNQGASSWHTREGYSGTCTPRCTRSPSTKNVASWLALYSTWVGCPRPSATWPLRAERHGERTPRAQGGIGFESGGGQGCGEPRVAVASTVDAGRPADEGDVPVPEVEQMADGQFGTVPGAPTRVRIRMTMRICSPHPRGRSPARPGAHGRPTLLYAPTGTVPMPGKSALERRSSVGARSPPPTKIRTRSGPTPPPVRQFHAFPQRRSHWTRVPPADQEPAGRPSCFLRHSATRPGPRAEMPITEVVDSLLRPRFDPTPPRQCPDLHK